MYVLSIDVREGEGRNGLECWCVRGRGEVAGMWFSANVWVREGIVLVCMIG